MKRGLGSCSDFATPTITAFSVEIVITTKGARNAAFTPVFT